MKTHNPIKTKRNTFRIYGKIISELRPQNLFRGKSGNVAYKNDMVNTGDITV